MNTSETSKMTNAEKRRRENNSKIYNILHEAGDKWTYREEIASLFNKKPSWVNTRIANMRDLVAEGKAPIYAYPISYKTGYKLYKFATEDERKSYVVSRFGADKKETERILPVVAALSNSKTAELSDVAASYYSFYEELFNSGYRRGEYWMEYDETADVNFY